MTEILDLLSIETEPGIRFCFDGTYIINADKVERDPLVIASLPAASFVDKLTPSIKSYNTMCLPAHRIKVKQDFDETAIDATKWNVPASYTTLTLSDIADRLYNEQTKRGLDDDLYNTRADRIQQELLAYHQDNKIDMLRLMIYIVDRLIDTNSIWGVGRGSSVSSYVLFLIGVHDIDSVLYDLDFGDFMK